jgi:type II secretory pathway pseudopilin PulG
MRNARAKLLRGEAGIALLVALAVILILSGLALSMVSLTTSQTQLAKTMENQTKVYYAALAGVEEARGRLDPAAPDALSPSSLPTAVNQVVYLVNGTTQDPVQPTNTASAYYDTEYAREFTGGLASATVLTAVSSDQPGVGTVSAIPYKWVRITLKTEYSSGQDINQDGTLNTTTPVYWDGTHQNLTGTGVPVYKLTALAVGASGMRQMAQVEVAGRVSPYSALGSLATGGTGTLAGTNVGGTRSGAGRFGRRHTTGTPNLVVDGLDTINASPCGSAGVPGLVTVGTASVTTATVSGTPTPTQQVTSLPSSPADFINGLRGEATPILSADPTHVSLASGGTSYAGTNVVLGTQASGTTPAQPAIVYADKPLTISGSSSAGDGILLVSGNLSIAGGFGYTGLIVVDGSVTLASDSTGSLKIEGSVISSGNLSANSTQSASDGLTVLYDSCGIVDTLQNLPKTLLAFRLL